MPSLMFHGVVKNQHKIELPVARYVPFRLVVYLNGAHLCSQGETSARTLVVLGGKIG